MKDQTLGSSVHVREVALDGTNNTTVTPSRKGQVLQWEIVCNNDFKFGGVGQTLSSLTYAFPSDTAKVIPVGGDFDLYASVASTATIIEYY